jgi:putative ubiquitin-RnfH superfamily antitoxin RatB of RatAB toxin-antitoxin module
VLVSENTELLGALATTVGVWLGTGVRRTRIRVKDGDREVEIDSTTLKDPHEVVRRIVGQLRDGSS